MSEYLKINLFVDLRMDGPIIIMEEQTNYTTNKYNYRVATQLQITMMLCYCKTNSNN